MDRWKPRTEFLPDMPRRDVVAGVIIGVAAVAVSVVLGLCAGCQFGLGGTLDDMGPDGNNAAVVLTGLDARGADIKPVGVDASDEETNTGTQGATTIEGDGATVVNLQAIGGGSAALLIAGLGAVAVTLRRKSGDATEALDRVMHAVQKHGRNTEAGAAIRRHIHEAGCAKHPTRGHEHDRAEAVIRDRLGLIKVANQ